MKSEKLGRNFLVPGFKFSGVSAGIKKGKKLDLALIFSEVPAQAVATFTTNRVQAAPVLQGKKVIKNGKIQAVIVNSGNANAVTGPQGLRDAFQTAKLVAKELKISTDSVLVSSTGKIGVPLDMKKFLTGIPRAARALSPARLLQAAEAIRTTDAFPKFHQVSGKIQGKPFTIAGIAKGAGMISPNMATMLAYVFTDLDIDFPTMRKLWREVVAQTFNSITVDGDTSTNDTALWMASGASKIPKIGNRSPHLKLVKLKLLEVCQHLAWRMVQDAEGGTKLVKIEVIGAKNPRSARKIADTIARSPLVKTSFFGEDPNWGRVFAAVGYSGETFQPSKVDIYYGSVPLVLKGVPQGKHQKKAHQVMKNSTFSVLVDLHQGKGEAQIYTSDLTYDYVKINAEYST